MPEEGAEMTAETTLAEAGHLIAFNAVLVDLVTLEAVYITARRKYEEAKKAEKRGGAAPEVVQSLLREMNDVRRQRAEAEEKLREMYLSALRRQA